MNITEFKKLVEQLINALDWVNRSQSELERLAAHSEVSRLKKLIKAALDKPITID